MRLIRYSLIVLILLGVGLNSGLAYEPDAPPGVRDMQSRAARFEETRCRFQEPLGADLTCGDLIVPEDRSQERGPMIHLHVAIFKSLSDNPKPDPVIYLEGGPGGSALESVWWSYEALILPFLGERDFITFDQRGVGYSEPHLDCSELNGVGYDSVNQFLIPTDAVREQLDAIARCRERLIREGVSLQAYNSAESAADVEDLRRLLGYDTWNLFGISYGTRLALTAMRDYPEGIRSVILDSTYPLEVDLYSAMPSSVSRALKMLFVTCEADPECNAKYPDLETVFYKLVRQLNERPVTVEIDSPLSGETEVLLSGNGLIGIMFGFLYSEYLIPSLPRMIYRARTGDYDILALIHLGRAVSYGNYLGMYFSVQCHEEVPFSSADSILSNTEIYPDVKDFFDSSFYLGKAIFSICQFWEAGTGEAHENLPVVSNIPTLILAGQYDPITPPEWGQLVNANLENSHYLEFPDLGHGVAPSTECTLRIANAFFSDPDERPDASCAARNAPYFVVIGAPVKMILYTDPERTFVGSRPDHWLELEPGSYVLGPLPEDPVIILRSFSEREFRSYINAHPAEHDFDFNRPPTREIESNDMTWQVYGVTHHGGRFILAFTERADGGRYLVEIQMMPQYEDWLYESVFLAAIDSFRPIE